MPDRRSVAVSLGVTAALAGALGAAAITRDAHYDYQGVCVEDSTGKRVPDSECRSSPRFAGSAARWYYLRSDQRFPSLGERASGGSFDVPRAGSVHAGDVVAKGGHVSRGGFGGFHVRGGS